MTHLCDSNTLKSNKHWWHCLDTNDVDIAMDIFINTINIAVSTSASSKTLKLLNTNKENGILKNRYL